MLDCVPKMQPQKLYLFGNWTIHLSQPILSGFTTVDSFNEITKTHTDTQRHIMKKKHYKLVFVISSCVRLQ